MYDGLEKPLFGEARPRDRYFNYVIGGVTVLLVSETLISSLVFPQFPPKAINVFLAFVIALICVSELTLIYWYRQGDVDPKFKKMIYFNSFTTVLLCVCANIYFHFRDHCSWQKWNSFRCLLCRLRMAGFVEKKNSEKNVSISFLHNHLSNHPPKRNMFIWLWSSLRGKKDFLQGRHLTK